MIVPVREKERSTPQSAAAAAGAAGAAGAPPTSTYGSQATGHNSDGSNDAADAVAKRDN